MLGGDAFGMDPTSWVGAPPEEDDDSSDAIGMYFAGSLNGLRERELQLVSAASEGRWQVLRLAVLGRAAQLRYDAMDRSPAELHEQHRELARLGRHIDQCKGWPEVSAMPPVLQCLRMWVHDMETRTAADLALATRLRAFLGHSQRVVQAYRTD